MTIQDAYNKGLDDAETRVVEILEKIIRGEDSDFFQNPLLDAIRRIVKTRSDYYLGLAKRNNNIGKTFRKRAAEEVETIDKLRD